MGNRHIPIPVNEDDGSGVSEFLRQSKLSSSDIEAIRSIREKFVKLGVLSNENGLDLTATLNRDQILNLMNRASSAAQYEKDFNPEYYRPEVEESLIAKKSDLSEFENPTL